MFFRELVLAIYDDAARSACVDTLVGEVVDHKAMNCVIVEVRMVHPAQSYQEQLRRFGRLLFRQVNL